MAQLVAVDFLPIGGKTTKEKTPIARLTWLIRLPGVSGHLPKEIASAVAAQRSGGILTAASSMMPALWDAHHLRLAIDATRCRALRAPNLRHRVLPTRI